MNYSMSNIKVTIVIPCLNVENFIEQCLHTVTHQTLKDIEIICVDGGSTDNTIKIIEKFRILDSRIKLLISNKKSYGYQVNLGFAHASGEYLGIVEPDDYIELNMYEKLYEVADRLKVDFVKSNFIKFYTSENKSVESILIKLCNDNSIYNKRVSPRKKMFIFDFEIPNWTGIFKKSFIQNNHILHNETPGASFQDTGFWFSTFACASKCAFLDEAFYHYRIDNPASSINNDKKVYCVCDEYEFIKQFLESKRLFRKFSSVYYYFMFIHYRGTTYRINEKEKNTFMNKFREDFIKPYQEKTLNLSRFKPSEINELYSVLKVSPLTKTQKIVSFASNLLWIAKHRSLRQSLKIFFDKIKNRIFSSK